MTHKKGFYGKLPHIRHNMIVNTLENIEDQKFLANNPKVAEAREWRKEAGRKLMELVDAIGKPEANKLNKAYFDTFDATPTDWKHYYEYLDNILVAEVHGEEWQLRQQELNREDEIVNMYEDGEEYRIDLAAAVANLRMANEYKEQILGEVD